MPFGGVDSIILGSKYLGFRVKGLGFRVSIILASKYSDFFKP